MLFRSDEADRLLTRALAYHGLGRNSDSDAALRTLNGSVPASDPIRIAEVHAFRGESDDAFQWLQAAPSSDVDESRIRYSPLLKSLHQDPRWSARIESMGDPCVGPDGSVQLTDRIGSTTHAEGTTAREGPPGSGQS